MEQLLPIAIGCVLAFAAIMTIIGTTVHDIRRIRLDKRFGLHPNARKFRRRPLISIIFAATEPSEACLKSIRSNDYKKVEIIFNSLSAKGSLYLPFASSMIIDKTAISQAVRQFNDNARLRMVELIPISKKPRTIGQLFRVYHSIVAAPFIAVRSGFGVALRRTAWPAIYRPGSLSSDWLTRLYVSFRRLARIANYTTLLYFIYLAIVAGLPAYLLVYIGAFSLWLVVAIWLYEQFSFRRKILYILAAPVSYGYFIFYTIIMPFSFIFVRIGNSLLRLHPSSETYRHTMQ
ncbi:MAG TPA: hypothetical protein VMT96_00795 [Candidatus Bathyarchaeia archaeon]|nr:hypothetical protein [Candidatus Bathyarchaeia archaeon]